MRRSLTLPIYALGIAAAVPWAGDARAADTVLCCVLGKAEGACAAQSSACAESSPFSLSLSNLSVSGAGSVPIPDADVDTTYASGTDGYVSWAAAGPWVGFCLDAPSAQDPSHAGPTEPVGCLVVSLAPGVGAEEAELEVPVDPRWDAYQLCYGPEATTGEGGATCQNVNDLDARNVAPTPVSGSCCSPPKALSVVGENPSNWDVTIGQAIPGVPPPVVVVEPDGGFGVYDEPDGANVLEPPDACIGAYNEPATCGQAPPASAEVVDVREGDGGGDAAVPSDAGDGGFSGPPSAPTGCTCKTAGAARDDARTTRAALALAGLVVGVRFARRRRRRPSSSL